MISYKVIWTALAQSQLSGIHHYLSLESLDVADQQVEVVLLVVDRLPDFPQRGRPGRWDDTRELVVTGTPYIVAYRLRQSFVEILAVLHGARRWPQAMN